MPGIKQRRYAAQIGETTNSMALKQSKLPFKKDVVTGQVVDFIIFAAHRADYYFPECGVMVQPTMKMGEIVALNNCHQCGGFIDEQSVADHFTDNGMYKNIPVVGRMKHSFGFDFSTPQRQF